MNLCFLCKPNHNSNHNIIKYSQKNYICQKHNEPFIKYCAKCNINICFSCDEEHDKHDTIFLGDLKPNMNEAKNKLLKMNKEIELFNNNIKNIIKQLNELMDIINIYNEININIVNSYAKQNRNYQILKNLDEINLNNMFYKTLYKINNNADTKYKLIDIIDFYNNINLNISNSDNSLNSNANINNIMNNNDFNFTKNNNINMSNNVNAFNFNNNFNMSNNPNVFKLNNNINMNNNPNVFNLNNNINMNNNPNAFNPNNNINMSNNINILNPINNMNMGNNVSIFNQNNNINNLKNMNHNMNIKINNNMNSFNNMNNNFNNNQINNNFNSTSLLQIIFKLHKIGLKNFGKISYMNSSLQCLANVQRLTHEILELHNQNIINYQSQPLTFVYSKLLFELKTASTTYIYPNFFKSKIEELNYLFREQKELDPKDFITFFIDKLHQELKTNNNYQNNMSLINSLQEELEARNENLALQRFINEFNENNSSIISDTFYGINRSVIKCDYCGVQKYTFKEFNILNFILKKVKQEKQKVFGGYIPKDYFIDLLDAFESENNLKEINMYCNSCLALKKGSIKQDIYKLPPYLIIVLNRGINNQDFRDDFDLREILNFPSLNTIICNPQTYTKYYICGIITYKGKNDSNGHYISYFRNNINEKFFKYDDTFVGEVSIDEALETKISKEGDDDIIPYVLFYHYYD